MKKIILSFLMGLMICSSFILGGCKKDEDKVYSISEMEKIFASAVGTTLDELKDLKFRAEHIGSSRYVGVFNLGAAADGLFFNDEGHCTYSGELICSTYSQQEIDNKTTTIDIIKDDLEIIKENIESAKFVYLAGYLVNLETGEWTLKDSESNQIYRQKKKLNLFFYESYLDFLQRHESVSLLNVHGNKKDSFENITVRSNNASMLKQFSLLKYSVVADSIENSVEFEVYDEYNIRDGKILINYNTLVHFSAPLGDIHLDTSGLIGVVSKNTFAAYSTNYNSMLHKADNDILVDNEEFYNGVLNEDIIKTISENFYTIYLDEAIQVEENDYFLTIYELATADKAGYVKYVKK